MAKRLVCGDKSYFSVTSSQPLSCHLFTYLWVIYCARWYLQSFQRELSKRMSNMSSIRVAARQLLDKSSATSPADESFVQGRLVDLTTKWDTVCRLSVRKQERLHEARSLVNSLPLCSFVELSLCVLLIRLLITRPHRCHSVAANSDQTLPWMICRSVRRSVRASVCWSVLSIVEKRRIGSGCRLAS